MSNYIIVADESVDFRIVLQLRKDGFVVHAIAELSPSIKDEDVLALAVKENALLITEDKDFGELVFRLRLVHKGIVLLRVFMPATEKIPFISRVLSQRYPEMLNMFSVLGDDKLRIKS